MLTRSTYDDSPSEPHRRDVAEQPAIAAERKRTAANFIAARDLEQLVCKFMISYPFFFPL